MPYKKSKARLTMSLEIQDISKRVRRAQRKIVEPEIREYVFAAAIFLAHAAVENYIDDVFSSLASGIQSLSLKGSALPENLRSHLFLHKLNKQKIITSAIGLHPEHDTLNALTKSLKGHAGTLVDDSRILCSIDGKDIYTSQKYPSKENLIKVFQRIGVPKIFETLSASMGRDSEAVLGSLGSLRTQLAHTGQIPGISGKDVIKKMKDVEAFVFAMDRLLYAYVAKNFKQTTWHINLA